MKTLPTLILFAFLPLIGLNAQKPLIINDDSISYRNQYHPGVTVIIPEVPYETLQKSWVKEMESGTRSKAVYENGEWSIFGANLKKVSPTPVNIYSKMANLDSAVKLMVTVELKKDFYIEKGSAETELANMKEFLKRFAKDQYATLADDQLKAEEKKLRDLEKELSSHQKDESGLEKSVRSDERNIKELEDDLSQFNNELTNLSAEIIAQNDQFTRLEEGPAKEEKAKYIKDLEKRKKRLVKDIKSSENKISKANSHIRNANSDIPKKQNLQKDARERIATQEAVVRKFEHKVNTIKEY